MSRQQSNLGQSESHKIQSKIGGDMQNKTDEPQGINADDGQKDTPSKQAMLNLQLLGLSFFHLAVLMGWVWLYSMQEIDHNMLFVLLILTGSIWFWLIVIARRRLALLAEHDRGRS
jgi:biotin transporter BioY